MVVKGCGEIDYTNGKLVDFYCCMYCPYRNSPSLCVARKLFSESVQVVVNDVSLIKSIQEGKPVEVQLDCVTPVGVDEVGLEVL